MDLKDSNGFTAFMYASRKGNARIERVLLGAGKQSTGAHSKTTMEVLNLLQALQFLFTDTCAVHFYPLFATMFGFTAIVLLNWIPVHFAQFIRMLQNQFSC